MEGMANYPELLKQKIAPSPSRQVDEATGIPKQSGTLSR